MARAAISLVFVWMLLASSRTFAAGPFGVIHVTLWQGGAFTDDNTGAFSHCSATYPYQGGNLLTLAQRGGGDWIIGFGNPSWNMTQGETVPFDITVDGQAQFYLTGTVASSKQVISILPVKVLEKSRCDRRVLSLQSAAVRQRRRHLRQHRRARAMRGYARHVVRSRPPAFQAPRMVCARSPPRERPTTARP